MERDKKFNNSVTTSSYCHHEIKWIDNCPSNFEPLFYRRYLGDTFILFRDPSHVAKFLNYLNSQHSCIKCTVDIEDNN